MSLTRAPHPCVRRLNRTEAHMGSQWDETCGDLVGSAVMHDNAGDDEAPVETDDEYTEPAQGDEEPESYGEEYADTAPPGDETAGGPPAVTGAGPDVFLDVPLLKVDEIDLDVEDLRAHVSLQAEVLDLLKLNVGADVTLGRVHLGISGVEAQAQLRVRLDNVALIINRVLTTLDRNPELLRELAQGVGSAVRDVGGGARQAVGELGTGAGTAVEDVGRGAGTAVEDVGRGAGTAVEDVGRGAGTAVEDVGRGAGTVAEDVGRGAGAAVRDVGGGAGRTVEEVGGEAGRTVGKAGEAAARTPRGVVDEVGEVTGTARRTADKDADAGADVVPAGGDVTSETGRVRRTAPRRTADRSAPSRGRAAARPRRVRGEDGKLPPHAGRRRTGEEPQEPP